MRIVVVIFSRKQVVSQPTTSSSQQTTRKDAKKRKHEEQDIDLQNMLNDAFQVLRSPNELANDLYNSYGQHLANELRKYNPTVT